MLANLLEPVVVLIGKGLVVVVVVVVVVVGGVVVVVVEVVEVVDNVLVIGTSPSLSKLIS